MCLLFSQPAIVFKRIYQLLLKMEDTFLDFDNHPANCYRVALTDNPLNVHEVCNQRTHRGTISLRLVMLIHHGTNGTSTLSISSQFR
jgi:hypothetical protein